LELAVLARTANHHFAELMLTSTWSGIKIREDKSDYCSKNSGTIPDHDSTLFRVTNDSSSTT